MSGRTARWTAWGLWALTVVAVAPTLSLASVNEPSSMRNMVFVSLLILAFSTVGALIGSRRPENPIGWLFCSGALAWILGELALEYGVYALITAPGTLPAGTWAAWFGGWARGIGWFLIVAFLLLLFPNGRLPSPRWRPVLWGATGYVGFFTLVIWLSPVSNDTRLAFVRNPLGLKIEVINLLLEILYLTMPLLLVAGAAAVIVRFRRSRGDERQQLKWFAYAVAVMVILFVLWFSLALSGLVVADALVFTVPLMGLPIAVGIAILRYRLYEIDLLINRTLVYGSITALLVATYLGGVVLLQGTFRVLTGQESQLAIVASTLLIAALFVPLRRQVQSFIDRRFYRKKYDAARTLQDFSTKLREKTDLDSLDAELLRVVRETVQPAHVSLWLRPASGPDRKEAVEQSR
jgi:fumarate reductase subunit C